jgi:hypothetical protein
MVSLRVGVRYYIKNVDFGSFPELPGKLAESEVMTSPVKVSEKQLVRDAKAMTQIEETSWPIALLLLVDECS